MKKINKMNLGSVLKLKGGSVILNSISYDDETNQIKFDYTVQENLSEDAKDKLELELKTFFDKQLQEGFLDFIKTKILDNYVGLSDQKK